jgi:hypothetical protein
MSFVGGPSTARNEYKSDFGQEQRGHEQRAQEPRGQEPRAHEQREAFITARNESGQFQSFGKEKAEAEPAGHSGERASAKSGDMGNMLRHIEQLESKLSAKDKQLLEAQQRVEKFSARTREGMQSALDSLMKKWMDACETKDEKCKEHFKHGMEKLVANSAEENGVWQMMVAASALHERQEHDLDKLRVENNELKQKIDGHYATPGSRTSDNVLGKRKAEEEPESGEDATSMWDSFAKDCAGF